VNANFHDEQPNLDLQQSLEWATASTAAAPSDMDAQTAALREAWTALGRLLEVVETPLEPSLVRRVERRFVRRRWLSIGAGLAVAVAIVIAVTAWLAGRPQPVSAPMVLPETIATNQPKSETPSPETPGAKKLPSVSVAQAAPGVAKGVKPQAASAAEPKWNDSVDDEIARVGQELVAVQQDWHAGADAFDPVRSRLERVNTEIEAADSEHSSTTPNKKQTEPPSPTKKAPSAGESRGSTDAFSLTSLLCQS
jgi:hypothetical protein